MLRVEDRNEKRQVTGTGLFHLENLSPRCRQMAPRASSSAAPLAFFHVEGISKAQGHSTKPQKGNGGRVRTETSGVVTSSTNRCISTTTQVRMHINTSRLLHPWRPRTNMQHEVLEKGRERESHTRDRGPLLFLDKRRTSESHRAAVFVQVEERDTRIGQTHTRMHIFTFSHTHTGMRENMVLEAWAQRGSEGPRESP